MKPKDEISKSAKVLFDGAKDLVAKALLDASKSNIKLEPRQLEFLLKLVDVTLDDGYHRGHDVFMKSVDKSLSNASQQPIQKVKKK